MDQLEYGNYHCVSRGFMDGWRCRVRLVLFFVDHVVQLWILSWAVFGDKRSDGMFCFFFLLAKQECWAVSIRICEGNDIFCAHTPPAAHKDEIGPHFFLSSPYQPPTLSVCLSSNHSVAPVSTISYIPIFFFPLQPRLHIYTRYSTPPPPTHSPGCHSNSVGGEHHYCFTPLCNHTPHPLPASPPIATARPTRPIAAYPTPAGRPQLPANEMCCFLRHSGGCKAAQQQWGVKKERS